MNLWLITFSFICYLVIELVRYVRYLKIYNMLNKLNRYDNETYSGKPDKFSYKNRDRIDNYRKFLDDLNNYPELMEDNLKDLFYSEIDLEHMNYDDVCE